jgi:hypothetical protein
MVCLIMYIKKYKTHKHTHVLERMSDTVYENLMHPYVCGFVVMEKNIWKKIQRCNCCFRTFINCVSVS